jgi:hypothetical protein
MQLAPEDPARELGDDNDDRCRHDGDIYAIIEMLWYEVRSTSPSLFPRLALESRWEWYRTPFSIENMLSKSQLEKELNDR